MNLVERLLTRVFPSETLPWGQRWKLFGSLTGNEDTSRSWLKRPLRLLGRSMYVHHMLRPDADRASHDHRYNWSSRILSGGYLEVTRDPSGVETFRTWQRGDVNRKHATQAHRVVQVVGGECWTLFSTGPAYRDWGFLVENPVDSTKVKWVHHKEYKESR